MQWEWLLQLINDNIGITAGITVSRNRDTVILGHRDTILEFQAQTNRKNIILAAGVSKIIR